MINAIKRFIKSKSPVLVVIKCLLAFVFTILFVLILVFVAGFITGFLGPCPYCN